jgi:hypothetical protein
MSGTSITILSLTHTYPTIRRIVANFEALCINKISLGTFPNLEALAIAMSQEKLISIVGRVANLIHNFNPQNPHVISSYIAIDRGIFNVNTLPRLTELTLTYLPCISSAILHMIATAFPSLTVLSLGCSERLELSHCSVCLDESMSQCIACPIPDAYPNVETLTVSII